MFKNMEQREPMTWTIDARHFPNPPGEIGGVLSFSIVCDGGQLPSTRSPRRAQTPIPSKSRNESRGSIRIAGKYIRGGASWIGSFSA
jgi:hypothetical protein